MGFQVDLLTGIAEHLHAGNVGMWSPTNVYGTNDVAITIDQLPIGSEGTPKGPDKAIAMTLYPVTDSGSTDSVIGLNLRIRGARNNRATVKDIADRAFDSLHDLQAVQLGGVPIVRAWRQSGAKLPPDDNNRQHASENFYLPVTRTGTNRRD